MRLGAVVKQKMVMGLPLTAIMAVMLCVRVMAMEPGGGMNIPLIDVNTMTQQMVTVPVTDTIPPVIRTAELPKVNTTPMVPQVPVSVSGIESIQTGQQAADTAPVTVDIIIFAGQSNMSGNGGNAMQASVVPAGHGYEYRPTSAPGALYPIAEPFGRYEGGYVSDSPSYQNGTMVSSFVNTYYSKTGIPVVGVCATHGGSDSAYWASSATKADMVSRFVKTRSYLESNNFKVRRKLLVFMQGESDSVKGVSKTEYKNNLIAAFQPLFANGLEQVFIITPGYAKNGVYSYDDIVSAQVDLCNSNNLFTLGSQMLHSVSMNAYLSDAVHYNQQALNMVGADAAARAAAYANGGM